MSLSVLTDKLFECFLTANITLSLLTGHAESLPGDTLVFVN